MPSSKKSLKPFINGLSTNISSKRDQLNLILYHCISIHLSSKTKSIQKEYSKKPWITSQFKFLIKCSNPKKFTKNTKWSSIVWKKSWKHKSKSLSPRNQNTIKSEKFWNWPNRPLVQKDDFINGFYLPSKIHCRIILRFWIFEFINFIWNFKIYIFNLEGWICLMIFNNLLHIWKNKNSHYLPLL